MATHTISASMASSTMDSMMSAMSTMSSQMSLMSKAMASASDSMAMSMSMASDSMAMPMTTSSMPGMSMPMPTDMSGMGGMDMGGDGQCLMEMSWNWNTINSCFLSRGWHVKTSGQFAGTCIGVFLWVVFLSVLSRARRALDGYIAKNGARKLAREELQQGNNYVEPSVSGGGQISSGGILQCTTEPLGCSENVKESTTKLYATSTAPSSERNHTGSPEPRSYRPDIFEQLLRALLYGFEYSFTWLLALIIMSFNGYVIVSAFLGATIGFMIVNWESMKLMVEEEPFTAEPVCC